MKRYLLIGPLFFVICISFVSCHHSSDYRHSTIEVTQKFNADSVYHFEIRREKADSRNALGGARTITDVSFRVLHGDSSFMPCVWRYGGSKIIDPPGHNKGIVQDFPDFRENMEIRFVINNKGSIVKLLDFDTTKALVRANLRKTYKIMAVSITDKQIDEVFQMLDHTFDTPESLTDTYFPEINLFFGTMGTSFKADSVYFSRSPIDNPLSGYPVIVTGSRFVEKIDHDTATIIQKLELPKESGSDLIDKTVDSVQVRSKTPITGPKPAVQLSSETRYAYDIKNKRVMNVLTVKIAKVDTVNTRESLEVIQKQ